MPIDLIACISRLTLVDDVLGVNGRFALELLRMLGEQVFKAGLDRL